MKRIAITMGDPAGIGPEIILKSLGFIGRNTIPVIIGDLKALSAIKDIPERHIKFKAFKEGGKGDVEFIDLSLIKDISLGKENAECGLASYKYLEEALKLIALSEVEGIVTCPVSKTAINLAGISFSGHTEVLASFSGTSDYVMMMANRKMRVALVTTHIPLKEVPESITEDKVFKTIYITDRGLKEFFRIERPYIKVCGLNPHAGEKGLMGNEEESIERAIIRAKELGILVDGPYPSDSLFHKIECDAFVAMYHDQGLIPVKTVDFRRTVNITLGLPFVRTSVGHGVAYEIAGKGIANPESLREAYRIAEEMTRNLQIWNDSRGKLKI